MINERNGIIKTNTINMKSNKDIESVIKEALDSLRQSLYAVKSVEQVNHKPHAYAIGREHIKEASDKHGGMLTKEVCRKIPCAVKGCKISYDEHTYDTVCFLVLKRNGTNDEANKTLKSLVAKLTETNNSKIVDGFAFLETTEKFRIK